MYIKNIPNNRSNMFRKFEEIRIIDQISAHSSTIEQNA